MMAVSMVSAQWGLVAFFGLPLPIAFTMNFIIYPIFPELAMPIVPLEDW